MSKNMKNLLSGAVEQLVNILFAIWPVSPKRLIPIRVTAPNQFSRES